MSTLNRRSFMKKGAQGAAFLAAGAAAAQEKESSMSAEPKSNTAKLPKRPYGNTGIELSIVGFGGIVLDGYKQEVANEEVAKAVERGINYFDVAPTYGQAEVLMGPALEPYRKDAFLACKTAKRSYDEAKAEFERSLERLRTDHFDLYQLHAITDLEKDVEAVFAEDGAMRLFKEEKKAGRIRHLGFSAHSIEAAMAAMDRYDFDSILFPINFATYYEGDFGPKVVKRAEEQGAARLALKAMALQKWPEGQGGREKFPKCWYEPISDRELASLAMRWTLSQPITAAIPPGDRDLFWMGVDIAADYTPINPEETERLQAKADELTPIFTAQA